MALHVRASLPVLLCLLASLAAAAPPGADPGPGREFVPSGGYRRTIKQMRALRRAPMALAPGQPLLVRGRRGVPVLLVEFQNRPIPFPTVDYQGLLFSEAEGALSMSAYYKKVSIGQFEVTGTVLGPYRLVGNDDAYEGNNNGLGGSHFGKMLQESLNEADASVDFGQFDNDGPDGLPNSGDDDGLVDTVFFIHPEKGAECFPRGFSPNIWSHSWQYSRDLGHSGPFVTNDTSNRLDRQTGEPIPGLKIQIDDYTIQPGISCSSTEANKKIIEIGVFCHEYGHALDLPDLYDRTPEQAPDSDGIGNWCLMAGGSYGGDGNHAERPCQMSAWCKYYLGWANVKPLSAVIQHQFEPVDLNNTIYRFNVPGTGELEYFLIEYRRKTAWDQFLHASGLAIWHVDERVGINSPEWPFTGHNQGQNDSPSRPTSNPPPLFADHALVALVQADGKMNLENPNNLLPRRGDADDLFTAGNFRDDPMGKLGSRGYDGKPSGLSIEAIQAGPNQGHMLANVVISAIQGGPMAAPPAFAAAPSRAAPALSPAERGDVEFAREIGAKVRDSGAKALNSGEKDRLKSIPERLLHQAAGDQPTTAVIQSAAAVIKAAAEARTQRVTMGMDPGMPLRDPLQRVLADNSNQDISVQFSPTHSRVERISGLSIDVGTMSPAEDAKRRLEGSWGDLIGYKSNAGTTLASQPTLTKTGPNDVARFVQSADVRGEKLPVFGKQVAWYYQAGTLVGFTNSSQDVVDVKGTPGSLSDQEAKEIVARIVGVKPEMLTKDPQEGVYVPKDNPQQPVVAVKVSVPVGDKQQDLEVYLDSQSKRVLEVK